MRVKLCTRGPHTLRYLAGQYDPTGMFHSCAKYDDRHEAGTNKSAVLLLESEARAS